MALPTEVGLLADTYYRMTAEQATRSAQAAKALWDSIPLDMSLVEGWPIIAPDLLDIVTEEQVAAGAMSGAYLQAQAEAQGFDLESLPDPAQFATPTDAAKRIVPDAAAEQAKITRLRLEKLLA